MGTVEKWCDCAVRAIARDLTNVVTWPNSSRKQAIKSRIKAQFGIPSCIGFIDGTHINLSNRPHRGPSSGSFHSRKERYGFNLMAIVDDKKRFTMIHWGFSAASSDLRIQRTLPLETDPQDYFEGREHLLADAGFFPSNHILPMYKRAQGEEVMVGIQVSHLLSTTLLAHSCRLTSTTKSNWLV